MAKARKTTAKAEGPKAPIRPPERKPPKFADKKVPTAKDLMTKNPATAVLPGTRSDVLRILVTRKLTGVPVVRKDGTLAGFVARKHIFAKPEEEQLAMLMVRDYPSVEATADLKTVVSALIDHDLHHLPVVSKGKLAGIITPADLLGYFGGLGIDKPVEDIIRSPCVAIHESTPINVASDIMRLGKVFALPVLDSDGKLSGLISDRDVFDLSVINGSVAIHDLGLAGDEDAWTWEGLRNVMRLYYEERKVNLPKIAVRDVMVRKPVTVFRKTGASEAATLMYRYDFGQLPVVDSADRLFAMLYELDIVAVLK